MKIRVLLLSLICALVSVPVVQAAKADDETELGAKMDKLNGAFRKLKRMVSDASQNPEALKLIATIRESAKASLTLEPVMKADIPADKQAKFVADYKAQMKSFNAEIDKLEAALKAGNNAEAAKLVDAMDKMKKDGHSKFKRKEK